MASSSDTENQKAIWRYLFPVICEYSNKIGHRLEEQGLEIIRSILCCQETSWLLDVPKKRDIERVRDTPFSIRTTYDTKAMLIQITGVEPAVPCSECIKGHGPLVGCIVMPPSKSAPVPGRSAAATSERKGPCANCRYRGMSCNRQRDGLAAYADIGRRSTSLQHEARPSPYSASQSPLNSAFIGPTFASSHSLPPKRGPGRPRKYPLGSNAELQALRPQPSSAQTQQPVHKYPHESNFSQYTQDNAQQVVTGQTHNLSPASPFYGLPSHQPPWPNTPSPQVSSSKAQGSAPADPGWLPPEQAHSQPWSLRPQSSVLNSSPSPYGVPPTGPRPATAPRPANEGLANGAAAQTPYLASKTPMERWSSHVRLRGENSPGEPSQSEAVQGKMVQQKAIERSISRHETAEDEITQVEPWEKAPGRIRSTVSKSIDSMFHPRFSYLTRSRVLCPD